MNDRDEDQFFEILAGRESEDVNSGLAKGARALRERVLDLEFERNVRLPQDVDAAQRARFKLLVDRLGQSEGTKNESAPESLPSRSERQLPQSLVGRFREFVASLQFNLVPATTFALLLFGLGFMSRIAIVDRPEDQIRGGNIPILEVTFRDETTAKEIRTTLSELGGDILEGPNLSGEYKVGFKRNAIDQALNQLQQLKQEGRLIEHVAKAAERPDRGKD